MQLTYPGPFDAVEVPDAGVIAERDIPVDIPATVAAGVVQSLLAQGWKPADDEATALLADSGDADSITEPPAPRTSRRTGVKKEN